MENSNESDNCCCCENPVLYTIPQKEVEHSCALDNVPFVISFYEDKLTTVSRKFSTTKENKAQNIELRLCFATMYSDSYGYLKINVLEIQLEYDKVNKNGSPFGRKRYKLKFRLCFTIRKTIKKLLLLCRLYGC